LWLHAADLRSRVPPRHHSSEERLQLRRRFGGIVHDRHPEADIIIPPRATTISRKTATTQGEQHIATIEKHGRIGWQRRSGDDRRSL
jgi:hypothetical protein